MTPNHPPEGFKYTIYGAPENWHHQVHGPCSALRVVEQDGVQYSYWRVSWAERLAILFGRNVRLAVIMDGHPPVALSTEI